MRSQFFPPVKVKPFFKIPITCVPARISAGYKPARMLIRMVMPRSDNKGTGCKITSRGKSMPVTWSNNGIKIILKIKARIAAINPIKKDSAMNCVNTCFLDAPKTLRIPISALLPDDCVVERLV